MKFYKVAYYEPCAGDFDIIYFVNKVNAEIHCKNMNNEKPDWGYYVEEMETQD